MALASIRLLESGLLSLHGEEEPFRVDAEALKISVEKLGEVFKVSAVNPLLGLDNRTNLLNRLWAHCQKNLKCFVVMAHLVRATFLIIVKEAVEGPLKLAIFSSHYHGIGHIWPDGEWLGHSYGDVGHHIV